MLKGVTLVLLLTATSGLLASEISDSIWEKLNRYNLMCQCFGDDFMASIDKKIMSAMDKCGGEKPPVTAVNLPMAVAPRAQMLRTAASPIKTYYIPAYQHHAYNPFLSNVYAGRRKRDADSGYLNPTKEDEMRFLGQLAEFKDTMETTIGNLTCVLQEMDILDAVGNINAAMLSYDSVKAMYGDSKAGSNPAWLAKYAEEMSDCLDISNAWPQTSLNRNPFMAKHGRHMIFFNCWKRCKDNLCAKYLMQQHLERMYGSGPTKPGMPEDKYDAAALAVKVMSETASPEEKFMDKFFWGKPMM